MVFTIRGVPKNLGAAFADLTYFPSEQEILLPPGESMKVAAITRDDETGQHCISLEYLGNNVQSVAEQYFQTGVVDCPRCRCPGRRPHET